MALLSLNELKNIEADKIATIQIHYHVFMNETFFFIWISLKLLLDGPIDNKSALVQVVAWHQAGNKPLSDPVLTQFTGTHICITGPQSVSPCDAGPVYMPLDIYIHIYL